MIVDKPVLHLLCGQIAAGKSTLARRLATGPNTILISEDEWLQALYADELQTLSDHYRCATRLRGIIGPHVAALLMQGVSIVLDFQANTLESRVWMRGVADRVIADGANAAVYLHVLDIPDALCLERMHERNRKGDHPFAPTEEQFWQIARYYVPPSDNEGFRIIRYTEKDQVLT